MIAKTQEIMKRRYIFPEMENAIHDYCLNCDICQRIKVDRSKLKGLLVNLTLLENPWQSISIDWIIKLPTIISDEKDYNTILVVVDRLIKMIHFMHSNENETARQTALALPDFTKDSSKVTRKLFHH